MFQSFLLAFSAGQNSFWIYSSALLLGVLHGFEPGHAKTMMAAFMIAIRGTVGQAILLALTATITHTLMVWVVAILGMYFLQQSSLTQLTLWLQLASAVLIIAMAIWMAFRVYQHRNFRKKQISLKRDAKHEHKHEHEHVHEFSCEDAHARAHLEELQRFQGNRKVTNRQIMLFGFSGGLVPCPAAITVLLLCLQFNQFTSGVLLVLLFSLGLALTLGLVGVLTALGIRHLKTKYVLKRRWIHRFENALSVFAILFLMLIGIVIGLQSAYALWLQAIILSF